MLWKGLAAWVWDNPWIKLQQERAEHEREPTPAERLVAAVTERGDEYVREQIRQRRTSPDARSDEVT